LKGFEICPSPDVIIAVKSRRVTLIGLETCTGGRKVLTPTVVGKLTPLL
jgi:hypothetical protein